MNAESFFEDRNTPKRKTIKKENIEKKDEVAIRRSVEAFIESMGKDIKSMLGQRDPQRTPKRSEKRIREQEEKNKEPLSAEMEAEFKEMRPQDEFTD